MSGILSRQDILELSEAAVGAGLVDKRRVLLGGLDEKLVADAPKASTDGAQVLQDLDYLNGVAALPDGRRPLEVWLENAAYLANPRVQAAVFERKLDALRAAPSGVPDKRGGAKIKPDLRVCFISSEYPPHEVGGLGVHVAQVTRALGERIDVDVLLPGRDDGSRYQDPPCPRVRLHAVPGRHQPDYLEPTSWLYFANNAAATIDQIADDTRIDVIHCHDWVTVLEGIRHRWLRDVPLVFHVHLPNRDRLCASIENLGLVCADLVTVSSDAMLTEVRNRGLSLPLVKVVKNGADLALFCPCDDWPADDGYILFVGRLVEQKGLEYLLRAFSIVTEKFPSLTLKIVGDGELKGSLKRLCASLLLSVADVADTKDDLPHRPCQVEFLGWRRGPDLARYYQRARAVVVPSTYEPFGMTAIEALACKRPVVASDVGGLNGIIKPDVNGFLARSKDELDLARWLMTLLSDADLRHRFGEAGRRMLQLEGYTWPAIADRIIGLYADLDANKGKKGKPSKKGKSSKRPLPEHAAHFIDQVKKLATEMDPNLKGSSVLHELFDWAGE